MASRISDLVSRSAPRTARVLTLPSLRGSGRHGFCLLLVAAVLGGVLLPVRQVSAGPAAPVPAAAPVAATGWYETILGGCRSVLDVPEVLLGTGGGSLAFSPGGFTTFTGPSLTGSASIPTAVAGGGAATSSTVIATAAQAGGWFLAGSAVAAGAFCGTVVGLENSFGNADEAWMVANSVDSPQGVTTSGLVPCLSVGLSENGDGSVCFTVSWEALPFLGSNVSPNNIVTQGWPFQSSGGYFGPGAVLNPYGRTSFAGLIQNIPLQVEGFMSSLVAPLYGPSGARFRIHCGDSPTCYLTRNTSVSIRNGTTTVYLGVNPLPDIQRRGVLQEAVNSRICKRPSDGLVQGTTATVSYWQSDGIPQGFEAPACPAGFAPTADVLSTRVDHGTSWVRNTPWTVQRQWQLPDDVVNNSTTLACFLPRTTVCPQYDPDPSNPNNSVQVGGVGGVQVSPAQAGTTVGTRLDEWAGLSDPEWAWEPAPQPPPTPSTTAVPPPATTAVTTTTVPNTTQPPPNTSVPPTPPPPVPPEPPGAGWSFGSCIGDSYGDLAESVTFNPVTWVRAILLYMAIPIVCAFLYLIVPESGWGALFADLGETLTESPLIAPVLEAITTFQTTDCLPVTFNAPRFFGDGPEVIDVGMCDNLVITGLWSMLFAFGVLGLAKEALDTVASFRKRQIARASVDQAGS